MTYAEIAEARGCSRAAAERWTQRQKLRRQPGNDGKTRVLVAPAVVEQALPRKAPRMDPADIAPALAAFEQALTDIREAHAGVTSTLREQLRKAEAEAERLSADLRQMAQQRIVAEQGRGDLVVRAERAEVDAREARAAAEALREREAAWWARGRWTRLRAAWRGE
jgi:hypothetical protein